MECRAGMSCTKVGAFVGCWLMLRCRRMCADAHGAHFETDGRRNANAADACHIFRQTCPSPLTSAHALTALQLFRFAVTSIAGTKPTSASHNPDSHNANNGTCST